MDLLLPLARQWVAGSDRAAALARAREVNKGGMAAILNLLGEHYTERERVEAAFREHETLVAAVAEEGLDACVSVKPTQFGLDVDEATFRSMAFDLLDLCRRHEMFLWLDMENADTTDATLRVYADLRAEYPDTGVALQANLRRTVKDLRTLLPEGVVRLVKGAYRESPAESFQRQREVDRNFAHLTEVLFRKAERIALGTHDDGLIRRGLRLQEEFQRDLEIQMLLGVRDPLKAELLAQGHRVVEYIPYGPDWLPYFTRRLQERPRNVLLMARSFLSP